MSDSEQSQPEQPHVRNTATDPMQSNAHWGTRALIELMYSQRLPNQNPSDLALDIDLLYRLQPKSFVVVLREQGCDVALPNVAWSQGVCQVWGHEGDARVFQVEITHRDGGSRDFTIQRTSIETALVWLCRQEQTND